ncbi:MAG: phosphate ABC transporter substrate-binding protein [Coriobacteriia bacterium]|nr:phosphate ABC transporter substrate-binding protein [Coriobacteriia bacterium]
MTNRLTRPNTINRPPHAAALARVMACVFLSLLLSGAVGCDRERSVDTELVVTGSTTILPIAEIAGEMYHDRHPDRKVLVSGLGSSAGIETVSAGSSDIGTSSRDLKPAEEDLGLYDTPIAYDAIVVIVNPDNPIEELTTTQVRAIFSGEIRNWSEVGGRDKEIGLVNRDEASGTREAFHKIVMGDESFDRTAAVLPGTGQVRSVVSNARGAIGYISLGFVNDEVKVVAIDGVVPTTETVVSGTYPLQRLLHFYTMGEPVGLARDFIDFVLSGEVQSTVVRDAGFTPISRKGS